MIVSFCAVLDGIFDLIESVSEGFPTLPTLVIKTRILTWAITAFA